MRVSELFDFVSKLYGIHDIFKYAKECELVISYYVIQNDDSLILDSGQDYVSGRNIMEENTRSQIQGSYLDSKHIEGETEKFVLFGLRDNLLPISNKPIQLFTEMIVIHELAHFIDQQGLAEKLNLEFNNCDREIGERIENEANKVAESTGAFRDLVHTKQFGEILNSLLRQRYNDLSPELMRISMSKTLIHIDESKIYRC